jgi:hypothetical protein
MVATHLPDESIFAALPESGRLDAELVELMLFLPRNQAAVLEQAAYENGLTVAQVVRRLIQQFTHQHCCTFPGQN